MPNRFVVVTMWTLIASQQTVRAFLPVACRSSPFGSSRLFASEITDDSSTAAAADGEEEATYTPWNRPPREDPPTRRNNKTRFRQHVNPLASQYQMQTPLSDAWPTDVFDDMTRSLHLDIGCSKGGFLLDIADKQPGKNYLGVEIRPVVAEFAQARVAKRGFTGTLNFVGCNANVDLDRLLTRYDSNGGGALDFVSIQFPDPHFKTQHNKRRVVTTLLVQTLAKFMVPDAVIFLQSDIQEVLDDMRLKFRDFDQYFEDEVKDVEEYMPENYLGIPTERETSVIERDLPVFRTIFRRTTTAFQEVKNEEEETQ